MHVLHANVCFLVGLGILLYIIDRPLVRTAAVAHRGDRGPVITHEADHAHWAAYNCGVFLKIV